MNLKRSYYNMSYGSDYLREAMTLNERKVNNKKSLK